MRAVRGEAADVDGVVLDLPPARLRCSRIVKAAGDDGPPALDRGQRAGGDCQFGPAVDRVPIDVATVMIGNEETPSSGRERRGMLKLAGRPPIGGRRGNLRPDRMTIEEAGSEDRATVKRIPECRIGHRQFIETERINPIGGHAGEVRLCGTPESDAPANGPPFTGLRFDQRLGGNDRRVEMRIESEPGEWWTIGRRIRL